MKKNILSLKGTIFTLSSLYILFISYLIFPTIINAYKAPAVPELGEIFTGIHLNELGDFLAGVFAPLAFFWLIATVLIQSEELRLQRNELKESREVAELTKEQITKQAAAMEQQSLILKSENEARIKATLDEQITLLISLIKNSLVITYQYKSAFTNNRSRMLLSIKNENIPADNIIAISVLTNNISNHLENYRSASPKNILNKEMYDQTMYMIGIISYIIKSRDKCNDGTVLLINTLMNTKIEIILKDIIDSFDKE